MESAPTYESLYHEAFRRYGVRALWSSREFDCPSREDALAIVESLRVEGDLEARRLAEAIEQACSAT